MTLEEHKIFKNLDLKEMAILVTNF